MRRLALVLLLAGCAAPPVPIATPPSAAPDPAVAAAQVRVLDAQASLARAQAEQLEADAARRVAEDEQRAGAAKIEGDRAASALADQCAKERLTVADYDAKKTKKAGKRAARQAVPDGVDVTVASNNAPEQVAISGGLTAPRLSVPCGGTATEAPKSRTFDATRH